MDIADRCKRLVADVQGLSQVELEEILKIIMKSNCNYTKNNNGIFVNLAWLPEESIVKLETYVRFCKQSKKELKKYESLCDVLNHKMYEQNNDAEAEGDAPTPCSGKQSKDIIADEDKFNAAKVSSSLRYYLLKKRYSKQQVVTTNCIHQLEKEDFAI